MGVKWFWIPVCRRYLSIMSLVFSLIILPTLAAHWNQWKQLRLSAIQHRSFILASPVGKTNRFHLLLMGKYSVRAAYIISAGNCISHINRKAEASSIRTCPRPVRQLSSMSFKPLAGIPLQVSQQQTCFAVNLVKMILDCYWVAALRMLLNHHCQWCSN